MLFISVSKSVADYMGGYMFGKIILCLEGVQVRSSSMTFDKAVDPAPSRSNTVAASKAASAKVC